MATRMSAAWISGDFVNAVVPRQRMMRHTREEPYSILQPVVRPQYILMMEIDPPFGLWQRVRQSQNKLAESREAQGFECQTAGTY
jgi:hypothetical protein